MHSPRRKATKAPRRSSSLGFTLIEVLMVVLIIAIIAATVIPAALNTSDLQAMSAARMIATDLQYAQDTAITSQIPVTVIFSTSGDSYTLRNASGSLIHPITKSAYLVDFRSMAGFQSVDLASASFSGAAQVSFDELGTPSQAGNVVIQAGPHAYTVTVAAVTGRVTASGS